MDYASSVGNLAAILSSHIKYWCLIWLEGLSSCSSNCSTFRVKWSIHIGLWLGRLAARLPTEIACTMPCLSHQRCKQSHIRKSDTLQSSRPNVSMIDFPDLVTSQKEPHIHTASGNFWKLAIIVHIAERLSTFQAIYMQRLQNDMPPEQWVQWLAKASFLN